MRLPPPLAGRRSKWPRDRLGTISRSIPLNDLVGSEDKTLYSFPGGHIGIYVSSRSQKELAPKVSQWLIDRCPPVKGKKKASSTRKKASSTKKKAAKTRTTKERGKQS